MKDSGSSRHNESVSLGDEPEPGDASGTGPLGMEPEIAKESAP